MRALKDQRCNCSNRASRQRNVENTVKLNTQEVEAAALKGKFEEEARKWHSCWPEENECCLFLKWEQSRAQAQMKALYEQIYE